MGLDWGLICSSTRMYNRPSLFLVASLLICVCKLCRLPCHARALPATGSSNYCVSAARGVQLIVANAIRLATVSAPTSRAERLNTRGLIRCMLLWCCVVCKSSTSRSILSKRCKMQVNVVGDIMLFLGKLAIAACCGLVAFGMANLQYYNDAVVIAVASLGGG